MPHTRLGDLVRAREAAKKEKKDQLRARHRLGTFVEPKEAFTREQIE